MTIIELRCHERLAAAVEGRQIYEDENKMMIVNNMDVIRKQSKWIEDTIFFYLLALFDFC